METPTPAPTRHGVSERAQQQGCQLQQTRTAARQNVKGWRTTGEQVPATSLVTNRSCASLGPGHSPAGAAALGSSVSRSFRLLLDSRSSSAEDRATTSPRTNRYTGSRIHSESRYANTLFTSLLDAWKSRHSTSCLLLLRKRSFSCSASRVARSRDDADAGAAGAAYSKHSKHSKRSTCVGLLSACSTHTCVRTCSCSCSCS